MAGTVSIQEVYVLLLVLLLVLRLVLRFVLRFVLRDRDIHEK